MPGSYLLKGKVLVVRDWPRGGSPHGPLTKSDITLVSLNGYGCPMAENDATSQGSHFWHVLAIETLFGSPQFVKT